MDERELLRIIKKAARDGRTELDLSDIVSFDGMPDK